MKESRYFCDLPKVTWFEEIKILIDDRVKINETQIKLCILRNIYKRTIFYTKLLRNDYFSVI